MNYEQQYIKYKTKYLALGYNTNQRGGLETVELKENNKKFKPILNLLLKYEKEYIIKNFYNLIENKKILSHRIRSRIWR